jgi:isopenicillin-N epimerase
VEALTKLAKAHGCIVMIDGAHSPGVLDINVQIIDADFYTGNCHKWLFAPKGCAFLWASSAFRFQHDSCPQPGVISSTGRYDYVGRFAYTGTRDYAAFAALPAALDFIDTSLGGLVAMRAYCSALLKQGCDMLVQAWGTSYLVSESTMRYGSTICSSSEPAVLC